MLVCDHRWRRPMSSAARGGLTGMTASRRTFRHALANTLVASVVNSTVWFAVTFWVYLETRSVFATGVISGIFLGLTALSGVWFGGIVDRHGKRNAMIGSSAASLALYAASLAVHLAAGPEAFRDPTSPVLWGFVLLLMSGVIVGNIRGIAMSTLVTLLVPEPERDRANGMVGTVTGVAFLVTSVISGLLIGMAGMLSVLLLAGGGPPPGGVGPPAPADPPPRARAPPGGGAPRP